jgi:predicted XRE-type DNA-binding protein
MTISLHLHDVKVHDRIRARLAAETEEWLRQRKLQQPEQVPGAERYVGIKPLTMRQTITADTHDKQATRSVWGSSGDGKHNDRNAARMTIPAVKPDHGHPITLIMLNHAFRKLGVAKKDAAQAMRVSPSCISNICNNKQQVSDERMREILACVWRLSVERDAA